MSDLISGKDAWIAKSEHKEVYWKLNGLDWQELTDSEFMSWDTSRFLGQTRYQFRLKPKTILLNGIEVPAPFEPKHGDDVWYISNALDCCYSRLVFNTGDDFGIGFWKSEDEIKQVVSALRSVFNAK